MFDNPSKLETRNEMGANVPTTVSDMRAMVREAAQPVPAGDTVKAAIGRAARRLGLEWGRARSFWYGDPRVSIRAAEAEQVRRLHQARTAARLAELRADLALHELDLARIADRLDGLR